MAQKWQFSQKRRVMHKKQQMILLTEESLDDTSFLFCVFKKGIFGNNNANIVG